jgi:hypothetical protein
VTWLSIVIFSTLVMLTFDWIILSEALTLAMLVILIFGWVILLEASRSKYLVVGWAANRRPFVQYISISTLTFAAPWVIVRCSLSTQKGLILNFISLVKSSNYRIAIEISVSWWLDAASTRTIGL